MKSYTQIDRLTEEQSAFAAENYPLIHSFLKENHLKEDDFFDVVVFGYLRAVKQYLEREELRRYTFSTIAWKDMRNAVGHYWEAQYAPKRNAVVVSLDMTGPDPELSLYEMIPEDSWELPLSVEDKLLEAAVLSKLTRRQRKLLAMRDEGWSDVTISRALDMSREEMDAQNRAIYRRYELEKRKMA